MRLSTGIEPAPTRSPAGSTIPMSDNTLEEALRIMGCLPRRCWNGHASQSSRSAR